MSERGEGKNMRHRLGTVAVAAMIALATGAAAKGLATRDLTGVSQAAAAALGSGFEAEADIRRSFCILHPNEPTWRLHRDEFFDGPNS